MRRWRGWVLGGVLTASFGGMAGFGYCCLPPEMPPLRVGMTRAEVDETWGPPVVVSADEMPHLYAMYQSKPDLFGDYRTVAVRFDEQGRVTEMESDDLTHGPYYPSEWPRGVVRFFGW